MVNEKHKATLERFVIVAHEDLKAPQWLYSMKQTAVVCD